MSEDTNKELKDRIHGIFPTPEVASALINAVVSNKPIGWGKKSNAPYFSEKYAEQVKKAIDRMIETQEPVVYRYEIFCKGPKAMTVNTLYQRIYQSTRYLCEKLDPDNKYKAWYEKIDISKDKSIQAVCIRWKFDYTGVEFSPEFIMSEEKMPKWRTNLEDWLESESIKPYIQENLCLTLDEVNKLKTELKEVRGIMASVNAVSVKVIRVNEE